MTTTKSDRIPCRWVVWRKNPETGKKEWLSQDDIWSLEAFMYCDRVAVDPLSMAREDARKFGGHVQCVAYKKPKPVGISTRAARIALAKGKRVRSLVSFRTMRLDEFFSYIVLMTDGTWAARGCMEPSEVAGRWEVVGG